jgi:hypothetical protein
MKKLDFDKKGLIIFAGSMKKLGHLIKKKTTIGIEIQPDLGR